jgi:hypothetical protein
MHFDDSEKPGRKAALKKLMETMGSLTGKKLSGLKPKAMSVEVEGSPDEEANESPEEASNEGDEPSEDEKAKIEELYNRYCK